MQDFTSTEFVVNDGEPMDTKQLWILDVDTVQPDITAYEMFRILRPTVHLPESAIGMDKNQVPLEMLRHFRKLGQW